MISVFIIRVDNPPPPLSASMISVSIIRFDHRLRLHHHVRWSPLSPLSRSMLFYVSIIRVIASSVIRVDECIRLHHKVRWSSLSPSSESIMSYICIIRTVLTSTLTIDMQEIPEMSVFNSTLTRLMAREDFSNLNCFLLL
jgi:hypothetical protein